MHPICDAISQRILTFAKERNPNGLCVYVCVCVCVYVCVQWGP
jgi:hypothetical protein